MMKYSPIPPPAWGGVPYLKESMYDLMCCKSINRNDKVLQKILYSIS